MICRWTSSGWRCSSRSQCPVKLIAGKSYLLPAAQSVLKITVYLGGWVYESTSCPCHRVKKWIKVWHWQTIIVWKSGLKNDIKRVCRIGEFFLLTFICWCYRNKVIKNIWDKIDFHSNPLFQDSTIPYLIRLLNNQLPWISSVKLFIHVYIDILSFNWNCNY